MTKRNKTYTAGGHNLRHQRAHSMRHSQQTPTAPGLSRHNRHEHRHGGQGEESCHGEQGNCGGGKGRRGQGQGCGHEHGEHHGKQGRGQGQGQGQGREHESGEHHSEHLGGQGKRGQGQGQRGQGQGRGCRREHKHLLPMTSAPVGAALRRIAKKHGYIASRGPHAGDGNPAELAFALDTGEVTTIKLQPEQRDRLITWLDQQTQTLDNEPLVEAIQMLMQQMGDTPRNGDGATTEQANGAEESEPSDEPTTIVA